jgi:prepilin-type N-terminal cleavage/methylation domain-containing protein
MPTWLAGRTETAEERGWNARGQGQVCSLALADVRASINRPRSSGVTLLEMLVVMAIIGLIVSISYPSATAGIDSVRLTTAGDNIASFLNSAVNRAERRQQPIEVVIMPAENRLSMYAADSAVVREIKLPDGIKLEKVLPENAEEAADTPRRVLFMPGATVPAIGVQFSNSHGGRRIVRLDPMTGFPRVESVGTE